MTCHFLFQFCFKFSSPYYEAAFTLGLKTPKTYRRLINGVDTEILCQNKPLCYICHITLCSNVTACGYATAECNVIDVQSARECA